MVKKYIKLVFDGGIKIVKVGGYRSHGSRFLIVCLNFTKIVDVILQVK